MPRKEMPASTSVRRTSGRGPFPQSIRWRARQSPPIWRDPPAMSSIHLAGPAAETGPSMLFARQKALRPEPAAAMIRCPLPPSPRWASFPAGAPTPAISAWIRSGSFCSAPTMEAAPSPFMPSMRTAASGPCATGDSTAGPALTPGTGSRGRTPTLPPSGPNGMRSWSATWVWTESASTSWTAPPRSFAIPAGTSGCRPDPAPAT